MISFHLHYLASEEQERILASRAQLLRSLWRQTIRVEAFVEGGLVDAGDLEVRSSWCEHNK